MTKFPILAIALVSSLVCGLTHAQDAPNPELSDIDRARIESEKARLAARNRPGSRIPYEQQRPPASIGTPPPLTTVQPPPVLSLPVPPPTVVMPCDQGGCFDSSGNRYNGGSANTYTNGAGRPCIKTGANLQCF